MKKVLVLVALVFAVTFVACGSSEAEKAAIEEQAKRTADSIAAALNEAMTATMTDTTAAPAEGDTAAATEAK